jgi:predicted nucleic acid-binding protein
MKVYLDVCCLNRLFDDAAQPRVGIEAAAVEQVLALVDAGVLTDHSSDMARAEIERIPDPDRRRKVAALLPPDDRIMPLSARLLEAAEALHASGYGLADAVHLAAAAESKVDVLLTVDDRFRRRAQRDAARFRFRVADPLTFLREVHDAADE